ncbi:YqcI/YcgG family protein [Saccharopolyspora sp. NPDC047091]|uniref:YqcI/YcgG family protein n=1 Tax=Saccharopolyspora sp. NPDC047091 TaxID=3155924 RepID=UPI0033E1025A
MGGKIDMPVLGSLFRASEGAPGTAEHFLDFARTAGAEDFPCVFAPQAFRRDELLFGHGDVRGPHAVVHLMDLAVDAIAANPDQVVVLWLDGIESDSLDEDCATARELLLTLLREGGAWPSDAPTDPKDPNWNFWYRGIDFFINISTRHHVRRRSRNLGKCFTLVVQSRASFDRLPRRAAAARTTIRERLVEYDGVPPSPHLGTHGEAPELPQFSLGDTNTCPYLPMTGEDLDNEQERNEPT